MKAPNFRYEKKLWKKGYKLVAGVDEVGRGCFAGPVVAGCVVFSWGIRIPGDIVVDDSKKLRPRQRKIVNDWIRENAVTYGTGEVSAGVINKIGMTKATQMAFRRAVANASNRLGKRVDYLLIDYFFAPYVRGLPMARKEARKNRKLNDGRARQKAIVNGDEKSISIAAASIVAKVYRDKYMASLGKKPRYKKYGWEKNRGYGTRQHQEAIKKYGVTRYHRKAFVETFLNKSKAQITKSRRS
jgi:ribonuclease HII